MISSNYVSMSQLPGLSLTRTTSESSNGARSAAPSAPPEGPPPGPPPGGPPPSDFAGADAESLFEALLETLDTDGDSSLSSDELEDTPFGDLLLQLDTIDADDDGLITAEEFESALQIEKEMREPWAAGGGEGGPPDLFDALLANDDANGDGAISADELAASPVGEMLSAQFGQIDMDGDGLITESEMATAESTARRMGPPPFGGPDRAAPDAGTRTDLYESLFNAINSQSGGEEVVISSDLAYRLLEQIGIGA